MPIWRRSQRSQRSLEPHESLPSPPFYRLSGGLGPDLGGLPATAADVDDALTRHFDPELISLGFDRQRGRTWVRANKAPIREVVSVTTLKGYRRVCTWGISLDFVPRANPGKGLTWHRTNASAAKAVLDLVVDPLDWRDEDEPGRFTFGALPAQTLDDRVRAVADQIRHEPGSWFERITDVASLVPLFEEAEARPASRFTFDMYTQHRFAYAFVLARLDQMTAAEHQLDAWLLRHAKVIDASLADEIRFRLRTAADGA